MTQPNAKEAKRELRRRVQSLLRGLSAQEFAAMGAQMQALLCQSGLWQNAESVFCYCGVLGEPDTRPLLQAALDQGKRLYLPRCVPGQPGQMEAVRVHSLTELAPAAYDLLEPTGQETTAPGEISLALLPCLAATRSGQRLGHGGGYYDRFLARFGGFSVLLCPNIALLRELPLEAHDLPADFVLTETELFSAE